MTLGLPHRRIYLSLLLAHRNPVFQRSGPKISQICAPSSTHLHARRLPQIGHFGMAALSVTLPTWRAHTQHERHLNSPSPYHSLTHSGPPTTAALTHLSITSQAWQAQRHGVQRAPALLKRRSARYSFGNRNCRRHFRWRSRANTAQNRDTRYSFHQGCLVRHRLGVRAVLRRVSRR